MGGSGDTHTLDDGASGDSPTSAVMVSVVIPTYNAGAQLAEQLDALTQQDFEGTWEVVLADNGSTDGSLAGLERYAGRLDLRVVDASERRGPSFARNLGATVAKGEWLAFCDADDVAAPQWLRELYAARERGDMISGVYEVERLNKPGLVTARAGVEYWSGLLRGPSDFMSFAPSGNFLMSRATFFEIGGFDETLPNPGCEDVDLSWRVQLGGRSLVLAADAIVHYRLRSTARSMYRQVRGYKAAEAALHQRYASAGMIRHPLKQTLRRMMWLVTRSPYLLMGQQRRLLWCAVAGEVAGYVRGHRFRPAAS